MIPFVPSKRRLLAIGAVALVLVVGLIGVGVLGAPAVEEVSNTFGEVSETETDIETDLVITNPNPIGLNLGGVGINYSVAMNDIHMATGALDGIEVGRGDTTVPLNSTMANEGITEWWPSHVAAGEVTEVDVDLTVSTDRFGREVDYTHTTTIDTDILGNFRSDEPRPIEADHAAVSDPILYINETDAEWGEPTDSETPIDKQFLLYNPNVEPYVLTQLGYEITMNGVPVGEGETDREVVIEGHSYEELDLTTTIDATTLDEWWVTHLDEETHGHQVSEFRIEFWAIVELPTGERVEVDLDALTYEEFVGTDIFDEGGDVGVPPDADPDDRDAEEDDTDDRADEDADDEFADDENDADDGPGDPPNDDDDAGDDTDDDDGLLDDDDVV